MRRSISKLSTLAACFGTLVIAGGTVVGQPATPPEQKAPASAPQAAPSVKLIDAGAEPRRPLRFSVKKGDAQAATMDLAMTMSMQMGETKMPAQNLPTMQTSMKTEVLDVAGDGSFTCRTVVGESKVQDDGSGNPLIKALNDAVAPMKGLQVDMTLSPRGEAKSMDLKKPEGMPPQSASMVESMRQSFSQLSVPFPEEPVGQGASWEVSTSPEMNGIKLDMVMRYKVEKIEDNVVTLKIEQTQSANPGEFAPPGMPPGAKASIKSLKGTGGGTMKLRLDRFVPEATMDTETNIDMAMDMGGQRQDITQAMKIKMQMKSAE